jgi:rhodanese-related sulfurtransferase
MAITWEFTKVYYFPGGTEEWVNAGYPVEVWGVD